MKYIKMLGLLAVAASALAVFAGTASASTLTAPQKTAMAIGSTIEGTSTNIELHGPFATVKCNDSVFKFTVEENQTKKGVDAGGKLSTLHFGSCNYSVTTPAETKLGTFRINSASEVFSSGTEITVHTSIGECVYTTNNTKLFTLTEGFNPVLHHGSAGIPRSGGSFFCGSTGTWTGTYWITNPSYLEVH
jgi:hypothetical protein